MTAARSGDRCVHGSGSHIGIRVLITHSMTDSNYAVAKAGSSDAMKVARLCPGDKVDEHAKSGLGGHVRNGIANLQTYDAGSINGPAGLGSQCLGRATNRVRDWDKLPT